jgi:hypothetical protein
MDAMLDLETMDTRHTAAIRSIGACVFDPDGEPGTHGATFYRNIRAMSCWIANRTVSESTLAWWAKQSQESQDALKADQRELVTVVDEFHMWFRQTKAERIWCHGANFDEPLWQSTAAAVGRTPPWKYSAVRCTRTVYHIAGLNDRAIPREGTYHNALDDALFQAKCVQLARKMLREGKDGGAQVAAE